MNALMYFILWAMIGTYDTAEFRDQSSVQESQVIRQVDSTPTGTSKPTSGGLTIQPKGRMANHNETLVRDDD